MLGVGFHILSGHQTDFEDARIQGVTESNDSEFQSTPHPVQHTVVILYFVPYKTIKFKFCL